MSQKVYHCILVILTLMALSMCVCLFSYVKSIPSYNGDGAVERRLAEANHNWLKGVEKRRKVEGLKRLYDDDPWGFRGGISIWDFFYPNYDCPHIVERVGGPGIGGKWICGLEKIAKRSKTECVVYSFGIGDNTFFEGELVRRTNCSIYIFDHTIETEYVGLSKLNPGRVFFEQVGVGVYNRENFRTIRSTMKKYNHTFIDIMNVDIEGNEFAVFSHIDKDFPYGIPVGQLQMQIHLPPEGKKGYFEKYIGWFKHLEKLGFRAFRNEINLFNAKLVNGNVPNLSHYSFLNVKYDNYLLHS